MADSDPTGRLGHPQFTCAHCLRIFTRYPSTIRHDPPKFCCNECKYAEFKKTGWPVAKPRVDSVCETCGKTEQVQPSAAKTRRFCSQGCMIVWRAKIAREQRYKPEAHVKITCDHCGAEFETHKCRIHGGRGRLCSRACVGAWTIRHAQNRISGAESRFFDELERAGLKFVRQESIGKWIVDAAFPELRIAVEFDGEYWHSLPKSIARDARKDADLMALGYTVIRVPERLHIEHNDIAVAMVAREVSMIAGGMA